jgi:hypothetical protein
MNPISSAVEGVAKGVMSGLDDLFTSDEERAAAQFRVQQMLQQPHTIAAMTTLAEAKHPNWYVAGWRPAIGWVCAAGIGWEFVLRPLLQWAMYSAALLMVDADKATAAKQIADGVPSVDAVTLIGLVTTLLGMGVIRMNEKVKGRARS